MVRWFNQPIAKIYAPIFDRYVNGGFNFPFPVDSAFVTISSTYLIQILIWHNHCYDNIWWKNDQSWVVDLIILHSDKNLNDLVNCISRIKNLLPVEMAFIY